MKMLILGLLLGLFLHKGLTAAHSYMWWTAEATEECRAVRDFPLIEKCVHEKVGIAADILPYLIVQPQYIFQKWELRY